MPHGAGRARLRRGGRFHPPGTDGVPRSGRGRDTPTPRAGEIKQSNGDLPADTDLADLARYVATIIYGIAVQAAGGASRGKLQRIAEMALRTLPL